MTLDVRRLCEGYQIAPRYDPEGVGGRYPDAVRVAVVHDRELKLLVGEVINNPAYGDGMGPQGMIGRQVYIADSREMIRQRRLTLEEANIVTQNATLPIREYRKSLAQAVLQEHKGRLVDAMYRRETVLTQISPDTAVYAKACALLNDRVDKLKDIVKRESAQSGMSQMSGYDADIDYLHRKQLDREGEPEETQDAKPIAFARDEQREQSIESGYAMRAGLLRMMYQDAALPEPPPEQVIGVDDSEDEAAKETLPLIPAETREVATTAETSTPAKADHAETDGKPEQDIAAPARDTVPETGLPKPTELAEQSTGSDPENDLDAADALPNQAEASDNGQHDAVSHSESEPEDLCHEASEQSQGDPITADASDNDCAQNALTSVSESQTQDTDFETSVTCPQDTGNAEATEPAETDYPEAETGHSEAISESPEVETDHPEAAADHPEAGTEQASVTDGDLRVSDCSANHKRVSLRELKERCEAEPPCAETVAETVKEEPPKPKLAYILRRGSEETASKSFSRMSELLKRHDQ